MAFISLPIYDGFTNFAIWSDPQNVSISNYNISILPIHLLKATSIYGLLSSTPILDAVPSGQMKTLPFYRGCKYVAYPARNTEEVKQVCLDHFNKYFS